jgi:light-regulated signal transduction histidine kinase (bacteriophytochrome)/CheY-like chemotaxis protein
LTEPTADAVDLTNCDREPIHLPGLIQPFGFLVAATADWMVARVSGNVGAFAGHEPAEVLGRPLGELFTPAALHEIRNRISMLRGADAVERLYGVDLIAGRPPFDLALHFSGQAIVIEAEPRSPDIAEATNQVRALMARLNQADSLMGFLREAARHVRALTGFDRVMVYRFDGGGSGEVVAEALRTGVDSFLGLNYPASDIPQQARALYLRNIFRIIADVNAEPAPITPTLDGAGQPLDQSLSVLRAVSPIHVEYLRNMGVEASLSISIVVGGRLWGLFACHHYAPRLPSFAERTLAELYGYMFSLMLESRERAETAEYERRARGIADRLMAAVAQDAGLLAQANWLGEMAMEAIPADGVAVYVEGARAMSGLTPNRAQLDRILQVLNRNAAGEIFATDSIAGLIPEALDYSHLAAGLLAVPLSRSPRDYLILFRSELLRTVRWAGNPEKAAAYGPNGARLTPRKSFEEWTELVKGRARPFSQAELGVAKTLRTALLEVVLQLSEDAIAQRRRAHEQQLLLIAELNHRVRNILALIRGLVSQSRANAVSNDAFISTLDSRIQALARAHDQVTAHRWGPGRLIELIEAEAGAYLGAKVARIALEGPDVLIEPSAFTALALVFHELITNAAKYGALSDSGKVTVRWSLDEGGELVLSWRERGGPPVQAPSRRGFGSTIIERSIPYELDGEAQVQFRLGGLEADFRVPARHVAGVAPTSPAPKAAAPPRPAPEAGPLKGRKVLLLEDSMLVALDAEDALRALSADSVVVAPSLGAALRAVDDGVDFAVLDFNLGAENSLAVAERLRAEGRPFIVATGYGEELELPPALADTPVVTKPYDVRTLRPAIEAALAADGP